MLAEFNRLNFQPVEYVDHKGESRRIVKMTEDGFIMVAMGVTVEAAMAFKEAYIAAFNDLAAYMATHRQNAISPPSWPSKHRLRVRRRGRIVPYPTPRPSDGSSAFSDRPILVLPSAPIP
jgi:hypothetical protein